MIELMAAVAIIGVLVAIALPSYRNQIVKGNRSGAEAMLMDVAQKEQQYFLDSRSYLAIANCAGLSALGINVDARVQQNYTCSVAVTAGPNPPPTFVVTATPVAGSRQVPDGALTIDNTGLKTPSDKW